MSHRQLYNFLTILPLMAAVAFGVGVWQNNGQLPWRDLLKTDFSLSGFFGVQSAQAQVAGCTEPSKSGAGEGRIYFSQCMQEFRMSKNTGDWESLGGSLWKKFTAPMNTNDIYNTNPGTVYVAKDAVFGVTNWGGTGVAPTLASLGFGQNLIYGTANYGITGSEYAFNLLQLQTFGLLEDGVTNDYTSRFSVNRDGLVQIGVGGQLVTPKLCLPDGRSCLSQLPEITGGATGAELWWQATSTFDQTNVTNRNLITGAIDTRAGGNVVITRDLSLSGDLTIGKNQVSEPLKWRTFEVSKENTSVIITDSWLDIFSTWKGSLPSSFDTSALTETKDEFVSYAVTNIGSLIIQNDYMESNYVPLLNTSPAQIKTVLLEPNVKLNAVCSAGKGLTSEAKEKYKLFIAGDKGLIKQYTYIENTKTWGWYSLLNVPSNININDLWCKRVAKSNKDSIEVHAVGDNGFIGKWECDEKVSFCVYTQIAAPDSNKPALKAIWGSLIDKNIDVTYEAARYYAVGNVKDQATTNTIYTWLSTDSTSTSITVNTNLNFNTVSGRLNNFGADNEMFKNWVWIGGDKGILYKIDLTMPTTATKISDSGLSDKYNINRLLVGNSEIVAALGIRPNQLQNIAENRSMLTYFFMNNNNGSINNSDPDKWDMLDNGSGRITPRTTLNTLSGIATTDRASTYPYNYKTRLFVQAIGGEKGLFYSTNNKGVWLFDYYECPAGSVPPPPLTKCFQAKNTPDWRSLQVLNGVDIFDLWHVPGAKQATDLVTYIAGVNGIQRGNNLKSFSMENIKLSSDLAVLQKISSVSGVDDDFVVGVGSANYSGTKKAVLLSRQPKATTQAVGYNSSDFNERCSFASPDEFKAVWSAKNISPQSYFALAVGSGGKIYLYKTVNNNAVSTSCDEVTSPTTKQLNSIFGVRNSANTGWVIYVVGDNKAVYQSTLTINASGTYTFSAWTNLEASFANVNYNGVWAANWNEVYVMGSPSLNNFSIYKYNGSSWSELTISDTDIKDQVKDKFFYDAWRGNNNTVYFSGSNGKILSQNNTTSAWSVVSFESNPVLYSVSGIDLIENQYVIATVGSVSSAFRLSSVNSALYSGDLVAEFNRWGVSALRNSMIPTIKPGGAAGDSIGSAQVFATDPINGSGYTCPPGEFMVGVKLSEDQGTGVVSVDKILCQKL